MSLKSVSLFAFVLFVSAVLSSALPAVEDNNGLIVSRAATNESHHLILGIRYYNDRLIYQEKIAEKYDWTGKKVIVTKTIHAPVNFVISHIKCLDQMTDGTGAEPTVVGGGIGSNFVELRFKSQRWHGIYFNVEVYGRS